MDRRRFIKGSAAAVGAATLPRKLYAQAAEAPAKIRFGTAVGLSGLFVDGSKSTTISQYDLWAKQINDAGGIMLSKYNKKVPVEIVYYDGRFDNNETIKLTEKLILDDKVEMMLAPWGTQWNIASAPITNKYEYPVIYTTAGDSILYTKANDWPYAFWSLAQPNESVQPIIDWLVTLKNDGKIKGRVAAINIGIELGVEMAKAFADLAPKAGLDLVFNKSYPPDVQDLQPLLREVMATEPDAFLSFSYPPDTFLVTGQAQQLGFSPDIFYVLIGGVFPGYRDAFGADKVEGVFAYGGQDPDAPGYAEYAQAMKDMYNQDVEAGALQVYACLQIVQWAIEKVGEIDRKKIRDEIAKGAPGTLWGDITWKNQLNANPWAVGQWQGGQMVGIFPAQKHNAKAPLFPKPKWG
jgi:branched-chain amino acid transport system substrate-binding protein